MARHIARPRPRSRRTRTALAIAGVVGLVFVLGVAAAGGIVVGRHLGSNSSSSEPAQATTPGPSPSTVPATVPPPPSTPALPASLADDFNQLQDRLQAQVGLVIAPVGNANAPLAFGDWQKGPAWSTIKVPLAVAGYREDQTVTDEMRAAITESDNAAAESIWAGLGDPVTAAHKVEQVLQQAGDNTVVQSQKVRPEFTAFGQTDWPLTEQARYLAFAACDQTSQPILDLMADVEPGQSWGLGRIPGARFKGGWGPSLSGDYLVRQIGLVSKDAETFSVAIAAQPDSGSFDDGVQDLNEMADWLTEHVAELPAGHC